MNLYLSEKIDNCIKFTFACVHTFFHGHKPVVIAIATSVDEFLAGPVADVVEVPLLVQVAVPSLRNLHALI